MFFLRVFSEGDLVCYSCGTQYCIGQLQGADGTETPQKTAFRRAGPIANFERLLLRVICFFCGVLKTGYSTPRGGSTAAVSGQTGEMSGLWACHKIQLENHQQLVNQKEILKENRKKNKSQCQHCLMTLADETGESWR